MTGLWLLAPAAGAAAGAGLFLAVLAAHGTTARPAVRPPGRLSRLARDLAGVRGAVAVGAGVATLVATGWLAGAVGVAVLVATWRGMGGAGGERRVLARLEALATWTESLRDTIAGAVGLEQAIPASLRAASPALQPPLARLVDRLHTRAPVAQALRGFADDLADPGADLIISALIINSQLRGPGLRDLLGALAGSAREELDLRRKVYADRRSTRRGAQIVIGVSVGLALALGVFDHSYVRVYDGTVGQFVLLVVVALYAAGIAWMRSLARFSSPGRLLARTPSQAPVPDEVRAGES